MGLVNDFLNKITGGGVAKKPTNDGSATKSMEALLKANGLYTLKPENWYTAKPYGFRIYFRDKNKPVIMYLPISPSNLSITTDFATNIIPTLYGTVEEHSDVRYFDISIEGTTGIAPKFVDPIEGELNGQTYSAGRKKGRSSFEVAQGISAGGFFPKTLAILNKSAGKASDLLNGGLKPKSGVADENTGYAAFHNLYRLLLQHKKDAAGISSTKVRDSKWHPITFFNHKDNNEYDVVVRGFSMRRSADNPMLYNYSIQLRGYNLRTVSTVYKVDDTAQRLSDLGLTGVDSSTFLGKAKDLASKAKSIVGALVGGLNVLGR